MLLTAAYYSQPHLANSPRIKTYLQLHIKTSRSSRGPPVPILEGAATGPPGTHSLPGPAARDQTSRVCMHINGCAAPPPGPARRPPLPPPLPHPMHPPAQSNASPQQSSAKIGSENRPVRPPARSHFSRDAHGASGPAGRRPHAAPRKRGRTQRLGNAAAHSASETRPHAAPLKRGRTQRL